MGNFVPGLLKGHSLGGAQHFAQANSYGAILLKLLTCLTILLHNVIGSHISCCKTILW